MWAPRIARSIVANLSLADRRRVLAASVVSAMLATLAAARGRRARSRRPARRARAARADPDPARVREGTALDVDRANQDVAAARAQLIDGDETLRQSRESLGEALGTATPISAPVGIDLEGFDRAVAATCHINNDVERRADVAAARERVEIADRGITDAKLMYAPSLGLASQGGYASEVTLGPNWTWTISANVTLPLYDGGARYGVMRDAKAAAQQARDALTSLRIAALIDAARASRAIRSTPRRATSRSSSAISRRASTRACAKATRRASARASTS